MVLASYVFTCVHLFDRPGRNLHPYEYDTDSSSLFVSAVWQQGPAPDNPLIVNSDTLTVGSVLSLGIKTLEDKQARLSDIVSVADFVRSSYSWYEEENKQAIEAGLARDLEEYEQYRDVLFGNDDDTDDADDFVLSAFDLLPYSFLLQPVFETLEEDAKVGGMLFVMFPWL